jgi:ERF superfamily
MPRSSESVAALAGALAKAQGELVNPEKSLTATIKGARAGDADRTFRYAPLSSGLEIVRKTLGQHQIAAIQTTAIDQAAGLVNLTTMLAHASGEWIASDWPVCPIADMVSPRRMGAALTYARRYALFTLVGIAGEDDLDAPDLHDAKVGPTGPTNGTGKAGVGQQGTPPGPRSVGNGHARGAAKPNVVVLPTDQSAVLRDRLLGEVACITEADAAATWARGVLAAKNSLTAADAALVEDAFEQRSARFLGAAVAEALALPQDPFVPAIAAIDPVAITPAPITPLPKADGAEGDQPSGINKSALKIGEPRRIRNKAHLRYVAHQPCLLCGRKPSDPHHLRFAQPRALGRKTSDEFAVPLCRIHHRLVHRVGNEAAWWQEAGIDPLKAAGKLWKRTRLPKPNGAKESIGSREEQAPSGTSEPTGLGDRPPV